LSSLALSACPEPTATPGPGDDPILIPDEGVGTPPQDAGALAPSDVTIESVTPPAGALAGGVRVRVTGTAFSLPANQGGDMRVLFDGAEATGCLSVPNRSDREVSCFTPPCVDPGPVTVRVENALGVAEAEGAYTCFSPVALDEVTPASGDVEGGTPVTLTGSGLHEGVVLLFGGRQAADLVVAADGNSATARTPPSSLTGRVDVEVLDSFGGATLPLGFRYTAALRLDDVSPSAALPDALVNLHGSGFSASTTVELGSAQAAVTAFVDDARVVARVPALAPGSYDVTVKDGADSATLADGLYVLAPPSGTLSIDAVVPPTGDVAGGTTVTLVGDRLTGTSSVSVGGTTAQSYAVLDDRRVRVVLPPGSLGPAQIALTTSDAGATTFDGFAYVDALATTAVSPARGPQAGGTSVTLSGRGFADGMRVRLGGIDVVDLTVSSPTTATFVTPGGPGGPVDVLVERGDERARLVDGFRYETELRVLGVEPLRGSMSGDDFVTVRGTGFSAAALGPAAAGTLLFGDQPARDVTVVSDSLLTAYTPMHPPGVVDVTASLATEQSSAPQAFTFFDPTNLLGGTRGGPIDGAVYVTVLDATTGLPAEGVIAFLGTEGEGTHMAVTNVFGQATLSGPDVRGPQTVSVAGAGWEYASYIDVNAAEITFYLFPPPPPPAPAHPGFFEACGDARLFPRGEQCDDGPECEDGEACREYPCDRCRFSFDCGPPPFRCHIDAAGVGTCNGDSGCDDGYECDVDMRCPDRTRCYEYPCQSCNEADDCPLLNNIPQRCLAGKCEYTQTDCFADHECAAARDVPQVCVQNACKLSREPLVCNEGYGCLVGDQPGPSVCMRPEGRDCEGIGDGACLPPDRAAGEPTNKCQQPDATDCADNGDGVCLMRSLDGCTAIPSECTFACHGDERCLQMCQCTLGCEIEMTIRGRVFGFDKALFDPAALGEDEIAMAVVVTTSRNEFSGTPDPCQFNLVFEEGGEYFLARSRPGTIALVALAGIFNLETGEFRPRQLGVRRGVPVEPPSHLTDQDITLTIPLDQEVDISLPDAPLAGLDEVGPTITRVLPFLRFGSEGTLLYTDEISTTPNFVLDAMPDVPAEMFSFVAGAYDTSSWGLITESGLASVVAGERTARGVGTEWLTGPFPGAPPMVIDGIFVVTAATGERWASRVIDAPSDTELLLEEPAPFTGDGLAYHVGDPGMAMSEVAQDGVGQLGGGVLLQPMLGLPVPQSPTRNGALHDRTLRWKAPPGQQPTIHLLYVWEALSVEVQWTFYVDGTRTKVPIPRIPESVAALDLDAVPADMPPGVYFWQHRSMYVPDLSYNNFAVYDELVPAARRSWTTDRSLFTYAGE
jgi:hypothetical protein